MHRVGFCFLKTKMGLAYFTSFIKKKKTRFFNLGRLTQPNLVIPSWFSKKKRNMLIYEHVGSRTQVLIIPSSKA
jgi:hypothetical protein